MRDGLSLLDQAIAQGGGNVNLVDVEGMLGTIKSAHTEAIIKALASHDVDSALEVVADMAECAVDFSVALDDVLMQLYYVSLAQLAPNALAATDANTTLVTKIAQSMSPETLQLFYQIGLISKRDIPLAPSLRVGFEMALLRMLAFEPADNASLSTVPGIASAPEPASVIEPVVNEGAKSVTPEVPATALGVIDEPSVEQVKIEPVQAVDLSKEAVSVVTPAAQVVSQPLPITPQNVSQVQVADSLGPTERQEASLVQASAEERAPWLDGPPSYEDSMPAYDSEPAINVDERYDVGPMSVQNEVTQPHVEVAEQAPSAQIATQSIRTPQEFAEAQAAMLQTQNAVPAPSGKSPQLFEQKQPSLIAVTLAGNNEWGELLEQTDLQGFAKELAMNCACERITDDKITLALSPKVEHLMRDDRVQQIEASLRKILKPHLAVTLDVEESDKETPAECLSRLGFEQHEEAVSNIKTDPAVQAIMSEFGATINEQSIKPV